MVNSESYEATQLEVFLLQYRYLIQTSVNVTYDENGISYGANNQEYTIILDKNRLVKTPGYEILLFEVERMEMHEGCLSIYSKKKWTCLEI